MDWLMADYPDGYKLLKQTDIDKIAEVQKADFKSSDFRNSRSQRNRLQEFWFSEYRKTIPY